MPTMIVAVKLVIGIWIELSRLVAVSRIVVELGWLVGKFVEDVAEVFSEAITVCKALPIISKWMKEGRKAIP
jgi:hypothetical protein